MSHAHKILSVYAIMCQEYAIFVVLFWYSSKLSAKSTKYISIKRNMTTTVKEPVKIRRKTLANGNISLYLAIYINGQREYEFLKLYLVPEKNKAGQRTKQTDFGSRKLNQSSKDC